MSTASGPSIAVASPSCTNAPRGTSGSPGLALPVAQTARTNLDAARAPGGVYELGRFGVNADTLAVLAYRGGVQSVADVERQTDDTLLSIRRIGPKRLAAIRAAVKRYRSCEPGSTPAFDDPLP